MEYNRLLNLPHDKTKIEITAKQLVGIVDEPDKEVEKRIWKARNDIGYNQYPSAPQKSAYE